MESEALLITALKNASTKDRAFSRLVDTYQERIYWYVRKIVQTHENADDVLQNTFIKAYKGIEGFQEKSSLLTWMLKIAHNESVRFLERYTKIEVVSISQNSQTNPLEIVHNDPYFDGNETVQKLHRIVGQLTDKQRQVFQMKYFDELSFKEISDVLQISENTLKSSYYTAVKIIEEKIIQN